MSKQHGHDFPQAVKVVAGVFYRLNHGLVEVLVFERRHKDAPGTSWEFPGGKVEKNESDQQALARELDEELGLKAKVADLIGHVTRQTPSGRWIDLWLYLAKANLEEIQLREHSGMKWISEKNLDLNEISWVEQPLVSVLFNHLAKSLVES